MEELMTKLRNEYAFLQDKAVDIKTAIEAVANQTETRLEGLQFFVKSFDSAYEKVVVRKCDEDFLSMRDIIRFTFITDEDSYGAKTEEILEVLPTQGFTVEGIKNFWNIDANPYNGINVQLKTEDDIFVEVQIHTEDSIMVKEVIHKYYEVWRVALEGSMESILAESQMREIASKQRIPVGAKDVKSF